MFGLGSPSVEIEVGVVSNLKNELLLGCDIFEKYKYLKDPIFNNITSGVDKLINVGGSETLLNSATDGEASSDGVSDVNGAEGGAQVMICTRMKQYDTPDTVERADADTQKSRQSNKSRTRVDVMQTPDVESDPDGWMGRIQMSDNENEAGEDIGTKHMQEASDMSQTNGDQRIDLEPEGAGGRVDKVTDPFRLSDKQINSWFEREAFKEAQKVDTTVKDGWNNDANRHPGCIDSTEEIEKAEDDGNDQDDWLGRIQLAENENESGTAEEHLKATADSSKMSMEGKGPRPENEFVGIQTIRADHKLQDHDVLYDLSVKPVFDLGAFREVKRESLSLLDEGSRDKQPVEDIFDVDVHDGRLMREMTMPEAYRHADGEFTKGRLVTEPCAEEVEKWLPGDENANIKNHREGQADAKCAIEQRHQEASIIMSGKETVCEMSGFDRVTPNDYDKQMILTSKQETLYPCRENPSVGEKMSATLTLRDYAAIKRDEWKPLVLVDDKGPRKVLHDANQEY